MTKENLPVVQEETPPVCKGCQKWEYFGKQCWVYWEKKKVCTMYLGSDPYRYYNGDPNAFWLL
ncbi:hypothetical protein HY488_03550 [Candidatus Woesearchaeota archaeon]|nr:hypothetical protein [Candidatus Woesearchaeota archaeon]